MYLDELKIWNFRKFGSESEPFNEAGELRPPDLHLSFNPGLNLLVGENDSGKSAIVEAIKLVCKTTSSEWIRIDRDDFFKTSNRFRIECIFRGFTDDEAANFIEWLGREEIEGERHSFLRLNLDVQRIENRILPSDVRGGPDDAGVPIDSGAKELLQLVYLKALRDAKAELAPKRNSRLSKILHGHRAFRGKDDVHILKEILEATKDQIDDYFRDNGKTVVDEDGRLLKKELDKLLGSFLPATAGVTSQFDVTARSLAEILESLKLTLSDEFCGLGSNNLLFIATELLLLQREKWNGLKLGLVEEIEAHLHPQAQLRVIDFLQRESLENSYQIIVTTHSPNLASKVDLKNLIVCTSDGQVFLMGPGNTHLDEASDDYKFLSRFLDVTKANMFFANGVILVEGYAEAILLPVIAEKLGKPLTQNGVSVVNVGSAAFLRFGKVFLRNDGKEMPIKVSIITDYDFRPARFSPAKNKEKLRKLLIEDAFTPAEIATRLTGRSIESSQVKTFFSPKWTLEYCLAFSTTLRKEFYKCVLHAWAEKKRAQGIKSTKSLDIALEKIENAFNNWSDSDESVAFEIYKKLILDKQLSKAAIAQYFAASLQSDAVKIDGRDPNIDYLVRAINFVTT